MQSQSRGFHFWFEFGLMPLVVIAAIVFHFWTGGSLLAFLILAPIGWVLWTLAEYWLHRVAHTSLAPRYVREQHNHHHRAPSDDLMFPMWLVPAVLVVLFILFPIALTAGIAAGYFAFIVLHQLTHHAKPESGTWLYRVIAQHERHHGDAEVNYGVTVDWWDRAFGTYQA